MHAACIGGKICMLKCNSEMCFPFPPFPDPMKNFLILAVLAGVVSGCATQTASPIDNTTSAAMLNQQIVQVVHPRPNFTAMTAGKVAFPGGLIGAMMMGASGNDIISQNNVQDPAIAIGRELTKAIALTRGAKVVPSPVTLGIGRCRRDRNVGARPCPVRAGRRNTRLELHLFPD
ncbi:hypothetical protein LP420_32560 [Massilia sp. B-10]|nr:hypothetical protein LP420_32560 [Massilia sp. B-10]